ncbi:hypothetical protein Tsubulata_035638 [Turnera subulata]|uniref:Uncharacterized protein n=1 Tax=Turnera subulata TaxID=218843 RepID=A0A9Q0GID8_9ROSI|nr:hypothetical protein Tsubulata_035638 [Turnera subulata]
MPEAKLGFFGLLRHSLSIPFKKPNFIVFTILTYLPSFCFLIMYETLFQHTLIRAGKILQDTPAADLHRNVFSDSFQTQVAIERMIGDIPLKFLALCLLYLGILYFLDLFNTIATVDMASIIYTEERAMSLWDMLCRLVKETRVKGPLITSICVLLLDSLLLFGMASVAPYIYITSTIFFSMLFSVIFIAFLVKYMEWSAIWNMGILISILEDKQGDVALVVSSYLSRDSRGFGLVLMLVFFAWNIALRLSSLYVGWTRGGSAVVVITGQVGAICLTNVLKWLMFVVYFYDCKEKSLRKKIDVEEASPPVQ